MKKTKRLISIILSFAMVMQVLVFAPFAMAEEEETTEIIFTEEELELIQSRRAATNGVSATSRYGYETKDGSTAFADGEAFGFGSAYSFVDPGVRKNTYNISSKQAYNGNNSLLVVHPSNAASGEINAPGGPTIKNKTLVASAMVLGTTYNQAAIDANENASLTMTFGGQPSGGTFSTPFGTGYGNTDCKTYGTPVLLSDISKDAPASSTGGQTTVSKDKWKMVHASGYTPRMSPPWTLIAGIIPSDRDIEFYIDDYYIGELEVVLVKNTTPETIYMPYEEESATVKLTAKAINQLGNSEYFDGATPSTYTWEKIDLPEGVTLEGDSLKVLRTAEEGQAKLEVTFNPTFVGSNEQTTEQKAARTTEVTLKIEKDPDAPKEPVVTELSLSGSVVNETDLIVDYDFWQVDGAGDASIINWYKRLPEDKDWGAPFLTGKKADAGTYKVTSDDEGYFIRVGVVPTTDSDPVYTAEEVFSNEVAKPTPPEARNIVVTGDQWTGAKWEADFEFFDLNIEDKEDKNGHIYQWFIEDSEAPDGWKEIGNEHNKTYIIRNEDANKKIKVGIKAASIQDEKNTDPDTLVATEWKYSEPRLASATPVVKNISIKKISKNILEASYEYYHPFDVKEGETIVEWYLGDKLIGKGSIFLPSLYDGQTITAKVTPYAQKEPSIGKFESVDYKVSFDGSGDEGTIELDYSEELFESLREETNLLKSDNPGVEGDSLWDTKNYYNVSSQRSEKYTISTNQAYSGKQSMLVKRPESGTYKDESHFPKYSSIIKDKTLVFSAMVLGTSANKAASSDAKASIKGGTLYSGGDYFNALPDEYIIGSKSALLNTMLSVPDSNSTEKASKDMWQLVHSGAVIPSDYSTKRYYSSAGVTIDGYNVELFVDDYYMGELVVAKVYNTTPEVIYIPIEKKYIEVPLTAFAINQLGTSDYFGEDSTFTWKEVSLPDGVTIEDDKLKVSRTASQGEVKLNVTFNPTFEGEAEQTDDQKKNRTTSVTLNIVAEPDAPKTPIVEEPILTGTVDEGSSLTVDYDFWQVDDETDASIITWQKKLPEAGDDEWTALETAPSGTKDVAGTYTAKKADEDYYIRACIEPKTLESGHKADLIYTNFAAKKTKPEARNIVVAGDQWTGAKWEADFEFFDLNIEDKEDESEGAHQYQWFVEDSEAPEGWKEIDGENDLNYVIRDVDANKKIKVGIKVASIQNENNADPDTLVATEWKYSQPRLACATPTVSNIEFESTSGSYVTVKYDYNHPCKISEGNTTIEWYNGNTHIGTGTKIKVSSYNGETLTVKIIPKAEKEPSYDPENDNIVEEEYKVSIKSTGGGSGSPGSSGPVFKPTKPIVVAPEPVALINVPNWAKAEVDFVIANKIMEPFAEGDFGGSEFIDRKEFMSAILKAAGIEKSDYRGEFGDVTSMDGFSGLLQAAVDKNIINKAELFYPERSLTRDEMCKIITASIKAVLNTEIQTGDIAVFADASTIQTWAKTYIADALGLGLVKGYETGAFLPKGTVTRSETAVIAKRIADYIKANGGDIK